jgi:hypothetical protein
MRKLMWILIACLVVVCASAWALISAREPSFAQKYASQVSVKGYQSISSSGAEHDANTDFSVQYVGPSTASNEEAVRLISAVGFMLAATTPATNGADVHLYGIEDQVAIGDGPDGCRLLVGKLQRGKMPFPTWKVSPERLARVRAGQLDILDVIVVCKRR